MIVVWWLCDGLCLALCVGLVIVGLVIVVWRSLSSGRSFVRQEHQRWQQQQQHQQQHRGHLGSSSWDGRTAHAPMSNRHRYSQYRWPTPFNPSARGPSLRPGSMRPPSPLRADDDDEARASKRRYYIGYRCACKWKARVATSRGSVALEKLRILGPGSTSSSSIFRKLVGIEQMADLILSFCRFKYLHFQSTPKRGDWYLTTGIQCRYHSGPPVNMEDSVHIPGAPHGPNAWLGPVHRFVRTRRFLAIQIPHCDRRSGMLVWCNVWTDANREGVRKGIDYCKRVPNNEDVPDHDFID